MRTEAFPFTAGCVLFNYRSCDGLQQTAMQNKPLAINSPSAGNDEKTTWGWFNALWSNNVMTYPPLRRASVSLWCCAFVAVCLDLCMSGLCYCCVPGAPAANAGNAIVFIVQRRQRWIIHWQRTLLNFGLLRSAHRSASWTHCLWSHHVMSGRKKPLDYRYTINVR